MPPKRKSGTPKTNVARKKEESPSPSGSEPDYKPEFLSAPKPKETKAAAKQSGRMSLKRNVARKKEESPPPSESEPEYEPELVSKKMKTTAATPAKTKKETTKKGGKEHISVAKTAPSLAAEKENASTTVSKLLIIEHCKQCQSFKRTAMRLETLLKDRIPDVEISFNPEKPRKGIFEVRDKNGFVHVSLQGLVRPFKKMKDLNLDETADDVARTLK